MRNSIPEYAKSIAPLHQLMKAAYLKAGKRTKLVVRKISFDNDWGAEHVTYEPLLDFAGCEISRKRAYSVGYLLSVDCTHYFHEFE